MDEEALERAELVSSLPTRDMDFNKICTTESLRASGLIPRGVVQLIDMMYQDMIKARRLQFKKGSGSVVLHFIFLYFGILSLSSKVFNALHLSLANMDRGLMAAPTGGNRRWRVLNPTPVFQAVDTNALIQRKRQRIEVGGSSNNPSLISSRSPSPRAQPSLPPADNVDKVVLA